MASNTPIPTWPGGPPGDAGPIDDGSLTPRELDVLRLVVEGRRDREIAERLGITEHTVHTHLKHLFVKLHATNRTELARRAERRMIPPLI